MVISRCLFVTSLEAFLHNSYSTVIECSCSVARSYGQIKGELFLQM